MNPTPKIIWRHLAFIMKEEPLSESQAGTWVEPLTVCNPAGKFHMKESDPDKTQT